MVIVIVLLLIIVFFILKNKSVNILSSKPERNYTLYICTYEYYGLFNKTDCFNSSNMINSKEDIRIHGGFVYEVLVPWTSLFVVFEPCENCKQINTININTSTYSSYPCSIEASIDINNIGRYNQKIYPNGTTEQLNAKDYIEIPLGNYFNEVDSVHITPNPNGCDLRISLDIPGAKIIS